MSIIVAAMMVVRFDCKGWETAFFYLLMTLATAMRTMNFE
jgi:hypothetical protein